jgi:hypothetical protein
LTGDQAFGKPSTGLLRGYATAGRDLRLAERAVLSDQPTGSVID